MLLQILQSVVIILTTINIFLNEVHAAPAVIHNNRAVQIQEVPAGKSVILHCQSNDDNHNFLYWHHVGTNLIIGPSNVYDKFKYRFEVLSGNLTIKEVSKNEEGLYNCVSRGVLNDNINIKSIHMVVQQDWEEVSEKDSTVNTVRIVIIIITLLLLAGILFLVYKMWKDRFKQPSYLEQSEDDDSAEEIFSAPGTSSAGDRNIVIKKSKLDNYEKNPSISTDFSSILDTANNK